MVRSKLSSFITYLNNNPRFVSIVAFVGILAFLTRFVNLTWGFPYPMHPDEWNMVLAIQRLTCHIPENPFTLKEFGMTCMNPGFFAYGQPMLYLGYFLSVALSYLQGYSLVPTAFGGNGLSFETVAISLRIFSALSSLLTIIVIYKIVMHLVKKTNIFGTHSLSHVELLFVGFIAIFQPYAIQFAHFGTTESVLMLCSLMLVYEGLQFLHKPNTKHIYRSALLIGISTAIKLSGVSFIVIPVLAVVVTFVRHMKENKHHVMDTLSHSAFQSIKVVLKAFSLAIIVCAVLSPQTLLQWNEFVRIMDYEIGVGRGTYPVFYTQQFIDSTPWVFQFIFIFPYTFGGIFLVFWALSFVTLPWKSAEMNYVRLTWLALIIPTVGLYAKWTRFPSPVYPIMTVMGIIFLILLGRQLDKIFVKNIQNKNLQLLGNIICALIIVRALLPGIAYLSVYTNDDVRFVASRWMAENVPFDAKIFREAVNPADAPLYEAYKDSKAEYQNKIYLIDQFDMYNVYDRALVQSLPMRVQVSDYSIIGSRRIFANYTCKIPPDALNFTAIMHNRLCSVSNENFKHLDAYYTSMFEEDSFELVKEFTSYPKIEVFGKVLYEIQDEFAEETWTVFDHPVIRLYKKL